MKKIAFCVAFLLCTIHLLAQPVINSFAPMQGATGTQVTIRGTGFSNTGAGNTVYFGAVKAVVSSATDSTLLVLAPAGATYQPISVTVNHLTAYSANSFVETFAGDNGSFNSNSFIAQSNLTTGMYPHSVSLADFNGDGKSDLLVVRGSSAVVSIFANNSGNGDIAFTGQSDFTATGNNHEDAAIADFDGDGKLDFVITNSNNLNSVSVFRNTSTGSAISFAAKIDYAATNAPYSVAAGDLDGDGKPDLIIANNGANNINVYRNTSTAGNISFDAVINYSAGSNPYSVIAQDLNGDGKPEIIFTTQGSSNALLVMKNNSAKGSFSFDAPVAYASLSGAFVVSAGDLDGDGMTDIAAASAAGTVVTIRNISSAGNLLLAAPLSFATGNYPVCVSISDLNGDGKPDIITADRYSNSVSVLKNISTAGNISFEANADYAVGADPFFAVCGDLDNDGRPDILVANTSETFVSVLKNISGAHIAPVINSFAPATGINGTVVKISGTNFTGATAVKFGDSAAKSFTVDSATGITAIVGAGASGKVSVTTGNGTATLAGFIYNGPIITSFNPAIGIAGTIVTITGVNFTDATSVQFGGTPAASFSVNSPTSITAIAGSGSSGSVTVTTANGTASLAGFSFGAPVITSFTPAAAPVGAVVAITGNNFDATTANNIVFFGAVKATVAAASPTQLTVIVPAGSTYQPISVTTHHLTAFSSQSFVTSFPADSLTISTSSFSLAGNYGTGIYPSAVSINDIDGDGKPDLIIANRNSNSISILANASTPGNIAIGTKTDFTTGTDPKQIAVGDLDGDGKPDIAVSNFNSGNASTISVFRNTSSSGTVSMTTKTDYSSGNGSIGIAIADMDGDGKPDIIVASGNSGFISFFKNISTAPGNISLAAKIDIPILSHADNIVVTDLDNDGKPDIITSNFSGSTITVFRNGSSGGVFSIASQTDYGAGSNPSSVSSADVDGDGRMDIVLSNYSSGNISFYRNNSTPGNILLALTQNYNLNVSNISAADLNGDGQVDLCNGIGLTGIISVLQNTGNIGFLPKVDFTTGNYDTFTATGDLDGDGKPELVATNTILNNVSILRNRISDPVIESLSVASAANGDTLTLTGKSLNGSLSVTFGGKAARSFSVVSSTSINAVVDSGASGSITVTTNHGAASIAGFKFIPGINAGGALSFCKGGSVLLSSTAGSNNQWYKDAVAISGATGVSYSANASGVYAVKTTSNGITTSSVAGITVSVTTVPVPVITEGINRSLVSSAATGNQWYLNGSPIAGATGQSYLPKEDGAYTVKDTANGCVSDFSNTFQFLLTGIIDLGNNQYIKLYPNPIKNNININWNINGVSQLIISITDINGKTIVPPRNIQNNTAINLSAAAPGFYFVKIYSHNQFTFNQTVKIIKGK